MIAPSLSSVSSTGSAAGSSAVSSAGFGGVAAPELVGVSRRVLSVDGLSYELWCTDSADKKNDKKNDENTENDDAIRRIHRSTILVPPDDKEEGEKEEGEKGKAKVLCISGAHFVSRACFAREAAAAAGAAAGAEVRLSEFVDGVSMNLFWDGRCGKWVLSTKRNVGGGGWFVRTEYSSFLGSDEEKGYGYVYAPQHTFLEMFEDAVGGEEAFHSLTRDCVCGWTYSFVVRHPAMPHLIAPDVAMACLISVQRPDEINPLYRSAVSSQKRAYDLVGAHDKIYTPFVDEHPVVIQDAAAQDVARALALADEWVTPSVPEGFRGRAGVNCVLTAFAGTEDKEDKEPICSMVCFTEEYERRRKLFGNDPNLMYRCIRLFLDKHRGESKEGGIDDASLFQRAFPWLREMYQWTERICMLYGSYLYKSYVQHFIKKTGEMYSPGLYYHMRQLHQLFLEAKSAGVLFRMSQEKALTYLYSLSVSALHAAVTEPMLGGEKAADAFLIGASMPFVNTNANAKNNGKRGKK